MTNSLTQPVFDVNFTDFEPTSRRKPMPCGDVHSGYLRLASRRPSPSTAKGCAYS